MNEPLPPIIEITPKLKSVKCRLMHYALYGVLNFAPILIALFVGYGYDAWVGVMLFLFLTFASGVVLSKMRHLCIPVQQREMSYSGFAIVQWYVAKNLCLEN
jgi:uncharacterized ion transporter superfamily protein YfcC